MLCPEGPLSSFSHPCQPLMYPDLERDAYAGKQSRPRSPPKEHPLLFQRDTESSLGGDRQVGLLLHFGASVDSDCSREVKRCLLARRKVMKNLDSKAETSLFKAMIFPVVVYRCESWTIKKAARGRIDAFELCCWRRLLRVPWMARRSSQSTLKEINPEYSLEGPMLKLKLQYFGHRCKELTHWKRLKAKEETFLCQQRST